MEKETMHLIEIKELRKAFGPIVAVDGISFTVDKGDVLGFLGPNGAGKSTTMKMLSGFLPPDGGTALVNGHDIITDVINVRRSLGYLAENAPAYDEMSAMGMLKFVCDARGIKGAAKRQAIDKVAVSCSITGVMHQQVGTLSKGYRRRLGLAQALIHDPDVLILDEPTDGLDPNQKYDVRNLIKSMASEKCIVISTHILEEADALCNRIIIIDEGAILIDETPESLTSRHNDSLDQAFRDLTHPASKAKARAKGGAA